MPTTDWHDRSNADKWRKIWEDMANAALEKHGHDSRIDRRSYAEQGIELIPTVHMGAAVSQMEKKGIRTERGDINRDAAITNSEIRQLNVRIVKAEKWLVEFKAKPDKPSLIDVIEEMSHRQGVSGLTRLYNFADVVNFLMRNHIIDFSELEDKVGDMHGNLDGIRDELKKLDRRIETLKKHLLQSCNHKLYRSYRRHYDKLRADYETAKNETGFGAKRKSEKAHKAVNEYRNSHRKELALYDEADKYFRDVLQSRYDPNKKPPVRKWEKELADKLYARDVLSQKFNSLKDETQRVEQIKRSVERILSSDTSESVPAGRVNIPKDKPSILEQIRRYSQVQQQQNSKQTHEKSHDIEM